MLHLILGGSGTGKTWLLREKIKACVEDGKKAILIVPEQYSFESEKALYRTLGPQKALLVEVLSFTRLCDRIFRELGGLAGEHMSETAKYLLMSVALKELGEGLEVYRRSSASAAFVSSMCETIGELKTAGATPEQLQEAASRSTDPDFQEKLGEIALIFQTYQALVAQGYTDPDDLLSKADKLLGEQEFFQSYQVFVDGFMAFMGAEWKLLGRILAQSPEVFVALTCQGLSEPNQTGPLAAACRTANRLVQMAREQGSQVSPPVVLREFRRFENPALAYLAEQLPLLRPQPLEAAAQGVEAVLCEDFYDELEWIAARISQLVREGWRYREIALICRDLERYLIPLQTVFQRYEIPFFADIREDAQVHPLVSGVLSALEAARTGYASEHVLSLAKNPITGISPLEAAQLENYAFVWNLSGKGWTQPFVNNPDGMEEGFSQEQQERLEQINQTRQKLIEPLERLRKALRDCDGQGFAAGIFGYLENCGAAENLQASLEGTPPQEAKAFLDKSAQVWDLLIELLDVFGGALARVRQPLPWLIDLFRLSVSTADLGELPQTLDQVVVGTADRIRPNSPRGVFVFGLNEGVFPQWGGTAGVFSQIERDQLKACGVDLLRTAEQSAMFERYFVYFAMTQGSQRLWMTCPMKDMAGTGLTPSTAMEQAERILGLESQESSRLTCGQRVSNEKTAFDLMTRGWRQATPEQSALRQWYQARDPQGAAVLEALQIPPAFRMEDRSAAKALFGKNLRISPSRVEEYYNCPFSYFCRSGLGLRPRRRAEFDPLGSGTIIHFVLEKIVKKYGGQGLWEVDPEALREEIRQLILENLSARIPDLEGMPARFKYLFGRLVNTTLRLIQRLALEFKESGFQPVAFELPIRRGGPVEPLRLVAADGTRVQVEGVVDRVDACQQDGETYVRVVDYKSGRKAFRLSDVYYGLNLQMLIYLFSICEDQKSIPAGVLYMPARDAVVSTERDSGEEQVRQERLKQLKTSGLLLRDRQVLAAMEPDLEGLFIPVKTKRDGSLTTAGAASALATLEEMGTLRRRVEALLLGIAKHLYKGEIDAAPVDKQDHSPCGWCDYHRICTHEEGDQVRPLAQMDNEEAWDKMKEGEEDV